MDKQLVKNNFSKYAHSYDKYASIQKTAAQKLIDSVTLPANKVLNILEIGCGTGIYTELLIDKFPLSKIAALDISPSMIETAKWKINNKAEFICEDGEEFEVKEKYDLITSNATLQWFNCLEKSLIKYKNLLKSDGKINFSIFGPNTYFELAHSIKEALNKNISILSEDFIPKDMLAKIAKNNFRKMTIKEEIITETNSSLKELLMKIKYTGTSSNLSKSGTIGREMLENIERIYKDKFGNIIATYQIFFCEAQL